MLRSLDAGGGSNSNSPEAGERTESSPETGLNLLKALGKTVNRLRYAFSGFDEKYTFGDLKKKLLEEKVQFGESEDTKSKPTLLDAFSRLTIIVPELKNYCSKGQDMGFRHDVGSMSVEFIRFFNFLLENIDQPQKSNKIIGPLIEDVKKDLSGKSWESLKLVCESLLVRSPDGKSFEEEFKDKDKGKTIDSLLEALKWRFCESHLSTSANVDFSIDSDEIGGCKIGIPHGDIFNFFNNCLSNALKPGIIAREMDDRRISFSVKKEGNNLVFSMSDNGKGMTDEIKGKVFNGESFSGGTGRGLRHADERFGSCGANIDVESSDNSDFSRTVEEKVTTFTLRVPILQVA